MYRKQWLRSMANVSMVGKLLGKMKIPVAVAYSGYAEQLEGPPARVFRIIRYKESISSLP